MAAPMPLMMREQAHPTAMRPVLLDGEQSVPVSDHAELAQGEGDEDADDVSWMSLVTSAL